MFQVFLLLILWFRLFIFSNFCLTFFFHVVFLFGGAKPDVKSQDSNGLSQLESVSQAEVPALLPVAGGLRAAAPGGAAAVRGAAGLEPWAGGASGDQFQGGELGFGFVMYFVVLWAPNFYFEVPKFLEIWECLR